VTAPTFESLALEIDPATRIAIVSMLTIGKTPRMGPAFWREMPEAFAWLDREDAVRAVILRGEGGNFSSGLDLASMGGELGPVLGGDALARERTALYETIQRMQRTMTAVADCRKPVVAAVAGACIGGGVDLITACDVRLCASDAKFSVREVRLAMVADVGTLARLPSIVGQGHARELALTGADIDAARALRIGLVNDVFDTHEALFTAARAMAERIAENPPLVVAGVKQVLNARSEREAAESLRTVALWNAAFLASHDLREAIQAFAEKRRPRFEGR